MTSELKCPVCNVPLEPIDDLLQCPNDHCAWVGNAELWAAFIKTMETLDWVANNRLADNPVRVEQLRQYARKALAQINHDNKE